MTVSPLSLSQDNAASVLLVLSDSISKLDSVTVGSTTLSSADLLKYIQSTSVTIKEQAFSERGAAGVVAPGTTGPVPVAKVSAPSSKPSKDSKEATREDASGNIQSLGVTIKKDQEDFGGWYKQVLTYGDMLDYYDVSGCYILKPASYGVWEMIQREL